MLDLSLWAIKREGKSVGLLGTHVGDILRNVDMRDCAVVVRRVTESCCSMKTTALRTKAASEKLGSSKNGDWK